MNTEHQENNIKKSASPIEMLTIEEFAERMQIGRTTAFQWIREGSLVQGLHFIKIGRVVRFPWGPGLIQELKNSNAKPVKAVPVRKNRKPGVKKTAINLDYH